MILVIRQYPLWKKLYERLTATMPSHWRHEGLSAKRIVKDKGASSPGEYLWRTVIPLSVRQGENCRCRVCLRGPSAGKNHLHRTHILNDNNECKITQSLFRDDEGKADTRAAA